MAQNPIPRLVAARIERWNQQHPNHRVDPGAARAVGLQEGYSGGIGDNGHAFGPFQLNNAGGVLTGMFPGQNPQQLQQWASSPAGIDFALSRIGQVSGGLTGGAAVRAIVGKFERPADIPGETARALAAYQSGGGQGASVGPPQPATGAAPLAPMAGRPFNLQQALGQISGGDYTGFYQGLGQHLGQQQQGQIPTGRVHGVVAAQAVQGGSKVGQSIARTALTQLNIPYQYGGQAKLGSRTDCSGLLQAAAAAHGVQIARTTYDQWKEGTAVKRGQLQAGDAVFFKGSDAHGDLPGHVGIYIGGGRFVEDPHTGGTVHISTLAGRTDYVGARRYA